MSEKDKLSGVPMARREFVQRLLRGSAFAVPVALGLSTIAIRDAQADVESSCTFDCPQDPPVALPEPGTMSLLSLGVAGAALAARRAARKNEDQD